MILDINCTHLQMQLKSCPLLIFQGKKESGGCKVKCGPLMIHLCVLIAAFVQKKYISIAALIHVNDFVHPTPTNVDVIQKKTFVLVNTLLTVLLFLKAATVLPFCTM
jgi:hypothetical protein